MPNTETIICICGHSEDAHDQRGCEAEECLCTGFKPSEEEGEDRVCQILRP